MFEAEPRDLVARVDSGLAERFEEVGLAGPRGAAYDEVLGSGDPFEGAERPLARRIAGRATWASQPQIRPPLNRATSTFPSDRAWSHKSSKVIRSDSQPHSAVSQAS